MSSGVTEVNPEEALPSLDALHPIVGLGDCQLWVLAPGQWVLMGVLVLGIGRWCWRRYQWIQHNRYRQEALHALKQLTPSLENLEPLVTLIRRVALSAYPRKQVASLTGEGWVQFLQNTGFLLEQKSDWLGAPYCSSSSNASSLKSLSDTQLRNIWQQAEQWIHRHGGDHAHS